MKQTQSILASLLLTALPVFAGTTPAPSAPTPVAETPDISYNNLEAGWFHRDFDGFDTTDGYYTYASFSPVQSLFVFAEWGQDFGDLVDRDLFSVGAGVFVPLVPRVHWVTTAAAGYVKTDTFGESDDSWAFDASTGLRVELCKACELQVAYNFSLNNDDESHSASVGLYFDVAPHVQLITRGYFSEEENGFGAGVRLNF
jgi:hypothetical protein